MCAAVTFVQRMCSTSAIPVGDDVARVGNANLDRVAFGNSPRRPARIITPIFISSAFPVGRVSCNSRFSYNHPRPAPQVFAVQSRKG